MASVSVRAAMDSRQQGIGEDRGEDLLAVGLSLLPKNLANLEMLLDPAEQHFDSPAAFVEDAGVETVWRSGWFARAAGVVALHDEPRKRVGSLELPLPAKVQRSMPRMPGVKRAPVLGFLSLANQKIDEKPSSYGHALAAFRAIRTFPGQPCAPRKKGITFDRRIRRPASR